MAVIPGGIHGGAIKLVCPHCKKEQLRGRAEASHQYECKNCGRKFSREQAEARPSHSEE